MQSNMSAIEFPQPGKVVGMATASMTDVTSPTVENMKSGGPSPNDVVAENPHQSPVILSSPSSEEWSMLNADAASIASSSSSSVPGPDLSAFGYSSSFPSKDVVKDESVPSLQIPSKDAKKGFWLSMRRRQAAEDALLLFQLDSTFLPVTHHSQCLNRAHGGRSSADTVPPKSRDRASQSPRFSSNAVPRTFLKRRLPARANTGASRCRIQRAPNDNVFLPQF